MSVKKAYEDVVAFLTANKDQRVSKILDTVISMCEPKARSEDSVRRNEKGEVTHVFCYYHKQWENVAVVEFGAKASSHTLLSNMCKEGTSSWTKQNNAYKNGHSGILEKVQSGDLAPEGITKAIEDLKTDKDAVIARKDGHGYAKVEDAVDASAADIEASLLEDSTEL